MNIWDAATWATVLVLGAGALVIFAACVREAWQILRHDDADAAEPR